MFHTPFIDRMGTERQYKNTFTCLFFHSLKKIKIWSTDLIWAN